MKSSDREWREAADLQPSTLWLLLVLLVATVLRFWGIGQGIPYAIGVDEPEIMERAFRMMRTADFNPRFFDYPGLYIYVQTAAAILRYLVGALRAEWASLAGAQIADFYLWGRSVTAILGVATVWIVYQAGLRWGARHALLASTLMAVMPMHVRESHYVLTDVPLTFFVALTLLLSLRAHEKATIGAFALAGIAAGLATATKYNGLFALMLPLLACWMTVPLRPSRLAAAAATATGCVAAFLIAAPYTVLDLPGFLNGFGHLANQYRTTPLVTDSPLRTYLRYLEIGFGFPALVLAIAGLIMGVVRIVRGPGRVRWTLTCVFPVWYLFFISEQRIIFGRYILPMLPMLTLLIATAVVSGVSLLRRYEIPRTARTVLIVALTVAAVVPGAVAAWQFDADLGRVSTTQLVYQWVRANVPKGAHITVETRRLLLDNTYDARNVASLIRERPSNRGLQYDDYVSDGTQYILASSEAYGSALSGPSTSADYGAYMELMQRCDELVRFTPDKQHPGPEWRVLKVRR